LAGISDASRWRGEQGLGHISARVEQTIRVSDPCDDRDDRRRDADPDGDTERSVKEGTSGNRGRAPADHTVDPIYSRGAAASRKRRL
jgi:hypothetical protein